MTGSTKWHTALGLSVLAHGLVLILVLTQPLNVPPAGPEPILVSLIETTPPPQLSPPAPENPTPVHEELPPQDPPSANAIEPMPQSATVEVQAQSSAVSLLEQLPAVIATLNPVTAPDNSPTHQGRPIPQLPGRASLFNAWLGPVSTRLDRWVDGSGGVNARLTLASGDVVCIKLRGPTTQELFNPWMSAAIPMARLCGKERPDEPLDFTDPWLRTRPQKREIGQ